LGAGRGRQNEEQQKKIGGEDIEHGGKRLDGKKKKKKSRGVRNCPFPVKGGPNTFLGRGNEGQVEDPKTKKKDGKEKNPLLRK